ncbi:MAG: hypothetical protein RR386_04985 [Bacteroidaceae bacterium]
MKLKSILVLLLFAGFTTMATAQISKSEIRCAYVIKSLKLNNAQATQFRPVLMAYLKELKVAKSGYENLKDKLKMAIKGHRISEAQATQLLAARWDSDAKELAVKKKYTPIFRKQLSARLTFETFSFANDNKEKRAGKSKQSEEE